MPPPSTQQSCLRKNVISGTESLQCTVEKNKQNKKKTKKNNDTPVYPFLLQQHHWNPGSCAGFNQSAQCFISVNELTFIIHCILRGSRGCTDATTVTSHPARNPGSRRQRALFFINFFPSSTIPQVPLLLVSRCMRHETIEHYQPAIQRQHIKQPNTVWCIRRPYDNLNINVYFARVWCWHWEICWVFSHVQCFCSLSLTVPPTISAQIFSFLFEHGP